jgi:hypothetical protein
MPDYQEEIVKVNLDQVKRKIAKLPSRIPTDVEKVPPPDWDRKLVDVIKGHAVWLILTYGAELLSYVSPFAGKAWKKFIKWRFNWESKDLPFI